MGNFAENLNLGNRFRPPPLHLLLFQTLKDFGKFYIQALYDLQFTASFQIVILTMYAMIFF